MKKAAKVIILCVISLFFSCVRGDEILIVIPNNFIGEFYIIEDKNNYQKPDAKAFENFGDFIYELKEEENEIRVKNINLFKKRDLIFSYLWVEPLKNENLNIIWESDKKIKIEVYEENIILEQKINLHESLIGFEELRLLCETETYIIRIDLLNNGNYRMVLWTIDKTQYESPDLVLVNGERIFDGSGGNHYYIFDLDNVKYILLVDILSRSYGEFIIYNGNEIFWYDKENAANILFEQKIIKIY
ncbi:MAG: hypothetical protein FWD28_00980 [Treponema sp.]|nr:hypothetical protein [Treponema sp.]